tara:strand:+ start:5682 stop:6254 length:573 start_codon:yes stop_codon:yes gene_type:complete
MRYATCHPNLKHKAKGLCLGCYRRSPEVRAVKNIYNKTPEAKAAKRLHSKTPRAQAVKRAYQEGYRQLHKANKNASQKAYHRARIESDINYRLAKNLRSRLTSAIKHNSKTGSAIRDLGCDIEFLKNYLESLFTKGMSWNNYGKWHIDHIKPLANFDLTNREELLKACHYTNLQPLWAIDNIRKSNKEVS